MNDEIIYFLQSGQFGFDHIEARGLCRDVQCPFGQQAIVSTFVTRAGFIQKPSTRASVEGILIIAWIVLILLSLLI
jgi:hypothetical protein